MVSDAMHQTVCIPLNICNMKRCLLIILIFAGLSAGLAGQDRIITLRNDTIVCKITKITRNEIQFDIVSQGVRAAGRLPLSEICSYSVSTLPMWEPGPAYPPAGTTPAGSLRIGFNGGMGYLTSSSESAEETMAGVGIEEENARDYYDNLKSGWYGSADVAWIINQRYGVGVKYKFFNTSAVTEGYFNLGDYYNLYYATYRENIYVNYGGLFLFYREPVGKKDLFSIYSAFSAGLTLYRNESEVFSQAILITGKAPGLDGTFGLEYKITPLVSAGAEVSVFASKLRKIDITDGETEQTQELDKEHHENLSRIEVSLGLRFYLWNR